MARLGKKFPHRDVENVFKCDFKNIKEKAIMNNPIAKLVSWQQSTGQLDGWTAYHIAAGAFLCKIFQWLHWSDFWCVMGVFIIGVLWEIFEWIIEDWRPYGSKKKWAYNTASDLIVETAMAWWMVL